MKVAQSSDLQMFQIAVLIISETYIVKINLCNADILTQAVLPFPPALCSFIRMLLFIFPTRPYH